MTGSATGDLRLLDQEVRDALSSWRSALDRAQEQEGINTESRTAFQPYILEHLAFAEMTATTRPDRLGELTRFTNDIGALASDRQLDNVLTYRILLSGDLAGRDRRLRESLLALLDVLPRSKATASGATVVWGER